MRLARSTPAAREGVDNGPGAGNEVGRDDEIGELVFEFGQMILGLGGKGGAAAVIDTDATLVDNARFSNAKPHSRLLEQCGLQEKEDGVLAKEVCVIIGTVIGVESTGTFAPAFKARNSHVVQDPCLEWLFQKPRRP